MNRKGKNVKVIGTCGPGWGLACLFGSGEPNRQEIFLTGLSAMLVTVGMVTVSFSVVTWYMMAEGGLACLFGSEEPDRQEILRIGLFAALV